MYVRRPFAADGRKKVAISAHIPPMALEVLEGFRSNGYTLSEAVTYCVGFMWGVLKGIGPVISVLDFEALQNDVTAGEAAGQILRTWLAAERPETSRKLEDILRTLPPLPTEVHPPAPRRSRKKTTRPTEEPPAASAQPADSVAAAEPAAIQRRTFPIGSIK